jgi:hypothetical protein
MNDADIIKALEIHADNIISLQRIGRKAVSE